MQENVLNAKLPIKSLASNRASGKPGMPFFGNPLYSIDQIVRLKLSQELKDIVLISWCIPRPLTMLVGVVASW
jgi:hypothetical protein